MTTKKTSKPPEFAVTIIEQLGGQVAISLMTGAKEFVFCDTAKRRSVQFAFEGSDRCNFVRVTLVNDLYDLEFNQITDLEIIPVETCEEIYDENLQVCFMRVTGLELRLPRFN